MLTAAYGAHDRKDWPAAMDLWSKVRETYPDIPDGFVHGSTALDQLLRHDEAQVWLDDGLARLPGSIQLLTHAAYRATHYRDWERAERLWNIVLKHDPGSEDAARQLMNASHHVQLAALGDGALQVADTSIQNYYPEGDATLADNTSRDLLLSFEGIGATCEFGAVQRHFRADPLGLLRWAAATPDKIARAISSRFEGVGDPSQTRLILMADKEYFVQDTKYDFALHTAIYQGDEDEAVILKRQNRILSFLAKKLLGDIESGEKIFVFNFPNRRISMAEIRALQDGLRRIGPATLLCMRIADEEHPSGSIQRLEGGVFIGYLERLTTHGPSILFDEWRRILRLVRLTADTTREGS